jgi:hypothetical protein
MCKGFTSNAEHAEFFGGNDAWPRDPHSVRGGPDQKQKSLETPYHLGVLGVLGV